MELFLKVLIVVNFLTTIAVLVYVSKRFDAETQANKETIAKQEVKIKLLFAENVALEQHIKWQNQDECH
jgi:hypothetical protein